MRKELYIILVILTCISCKNKNQLEIEFENHLPQSDQIILQKVVDAYDKLIKTQYNGNAYDFFSQIESDKPTFSNLNNREYCELLKLFDGSTLEYKSRNVKYDSVYLSEQGYVIAKVQPEDMSEDDLHLDEEIRVLPPDRILEEEIDKIEKKGYWRFISPSSFTSALSKISIENIVIQEYIDSKEVVGFINPQIMASSIRKNEMDVENYFIKRIIAIELFIKQIRKEYTC